MKSLCYQLALILIILNFASKIFSQSNIGISNDNSTPDPSAMLDVKSTTKGILIPRMTNAERNAIANPASGLMIYNNSENCFNFFNGTTWIKIVAGQDDDWTITGSDMFNNNPGNIGIGTATPDTKFTIHGDATDIKLDINQASGNPTQGLIFSVDHLERGSFHIEKSTNNLVIDADKNNSGLGDILLKKHGDDRLAIRSNGDIQFKKHGDDRLAIIGPVGNVGIGTATPDSRLTITGDATDVKLDINQASGNPTQGLIFSVDHLERGSFHIEKSTNNLVIDADKNNSGLGDILLKKHGDDRLAIRSNGDIQFKKHGDDRLAIIGPIGNVGIGTSAPWSRLTITGDSTNIAMNLNATSANNRQELKFMVDKIARSMIQFDKTTNNLTFEVDQNNQGTGDIVFKKHGDDRLAIRSNGDIQFKKHGDDMLAIIGSVGNVGIGTSVPDSRLTITGDATDVKLDINQASINPTQGLIFAVDHMERGSFHIEKSTNNLVIDADKNNSGFGDILLKKHGDDRLAIRSNGDIQFKKHGDDLLAIRGDNGNVGIGTLFPASKLTITGTETDIAMDIDLASPASSQKIKFAVEAVEKSTITHEKFTNDLVIEVDKNGENTGDIVFKKHGDDRLAIRNNGDVQFKRYGDDRLAIRGDNGNVGIGTSNPVSKLEVNGSVKVGNDPNPPTALNIGSIRYRTEANSSFCEMVMQTGPTSYAWVVIKQFTW